MADLWFTADLHLGHGNIIRYCDRPFLCASDRERARRDPAGSWNISPETLRNHDDSLIEAINERVAPGDTLWILGDFCLGPFERSEAYRARIRCRDVRLVRGNHDPPPCDRLFEQVIDQGMIKHRGRKIWLNHYPMRSWDKAYHGSWHLYGHVHGRLLEEDRANPRMLVRDIGVDATGYRPLSFDEIAEEMAPRIEAFRKWKQRLGER